MKHYTHDTKLIIAIKKQSNKGWISLLIYILAGVVACFSPWVSLILVFIPAVLWIVPDKNIEAAVNSMADENTDED